MLKPEYLLDPTLKELVAPPPAALVNPPVDDFLRYEIRPAAGGSFPWVPGPVTAQDQFGQSLIELLRARWSCTPVDVNHQHPTMPMHPDQLTGYLVKPNPLINVHTWVHTQFGGEHLKVRRKGVLCVPSRILCHTVCANGTNNGAPCTTAAQCTGGGSCSVPPCCCAPVGASVCTTDADCPASFCECS